MLEPCKRCFHTIMANYHGVVRCCGLPYSQREIRYGCQQRSCRPSQMLHQVTYDVVTTLICRNNA
eukprot:scaffold5002_cov141-Skeletonema_marinoi.AAC.1